MEDTSLRDRKDLQSQVSKVSFLMLSEKGGRAYSQVLAGTNRKFFWQWWAFSGRHFKGAKGVILRTWPWPDRSHARVCSNLSVWRVDEVIYVKILQFSLATIPCGLSISVLNGMDLRLLEMSPLCQSYRVLKPEASCKNHACSQFRTSLLGSKPEDYFLLGSPLSALCIPSTIVL